MAASTSSLISTSKDLREFLSTIESDNSLYLDLEGKSLSRDGTIALVTMLIHPQKVTRVVDVLTLGKSAFEIESVEGRSLKSILEDHEIPKYVWDVRNDADALWAHFQVALGGVTDIQLLENASRPDWIDKTRLCGLDKAIQYDLKLGFKNRERWLRTKREVRNLMSKDIFSERPLAPSTLQYCVNDVAHLPALQKFYMDRINPTWLVKAHKESKRRLADARSPEYKPQSPGKALGPWGGVSTTKLTLEEMDDREYEDFLWDLEYDEQEDEFDYWDDDVRCSADVDDFGGAFDSCWDKY
ncbi:hypothetical protein N8I77_005291 [Diaporthe amygdali]|uniref:3'-5' exonuclease domain-containing protein n=1 Tax=Phomopsis amygdali TaxID=1214568 RepID=A0AAD9W388_PHOAM|nr:hypothetical protein N8I77_005291 [Diaporthe amygdali]